MKYIIFFILFLNTERIFANTQNDSLKINYTLSLSPVFAGAWLWDNTGKMTTLYIDLGISLKGGIEFFNYRYRVGPDLKFFWTSGDGISPQWFYLAGIHNQFNFIPKRRNRLYIEASLLMSDLCICQRGLYGSIPERRPSMFYYGIGGGWSIYLNKNFDYNLGLMRYGLFNNVPDKKAWEHYIFVGIDYYFHPRHKPKFKKKPKIEGDLRK